MAFTKNAYFGSVKLPKKKTEFETLFEHALDVIIDILGTNPKFMYLVILTKDVYFWLVKLPVFT